MGGVDSASLKCDLQKKGGEEWPSAWIVLGERLDVAPSALVPANQKASYSGERFD